MPETEKKQIPDEILLRLRDIIAKAHWIFAITYAKTAPHEYCLREDLKRGDVTFSDMLFFAQCLWEYGYQQYFHSYLQRYLDVDTYKYWTMEPDAQSTSLMNRAPLTEEGIAELLRKNGFES